MTPDQIAQLLKLLEKIADRQFTITQASDWPILLFATGIGMAMIGSTWRGFVLCITASERRHSELTTDGWLESKCK